MPFNLLKVYNQLLDFLGMNPHQRNQSLRGVFQRDIEHNAGFRFRGKQINPTKGNEPPMSILFTHLTTVIVNEETRQREFEIKRSERLHWVKYHIDEKKEAGMIVFSVAESSGVRTYILDDAEGYVIILEAYRNQTEYYLLTAYFLEGRNTDKIKAKYRRRLPDVV